MFALMEMGSSPHARGALIYDRHHSAAARIIPACAGSTSYAHSIHEPTGDHPRMRGEHQTVMSTTFDIKGSSPHARGARFPLFNLLRRVGIIPACAGSTSPRLRRRICSRDHPRMRGEHATLVARVVRITGSSPHARGAPIVVIENPVLKGIIPACAGSTLHDRRVW